MLMIRLTHNQSMPIITSSYVLTKVE